ncbi:MAG: AtpZ/AtpI family protein [Limnochordales bacterium]|nr:AtpZ/AtpI family protein [Limnochordales bacterium]
MVPDLTVLRHSTAGISLVISTLIYLGLGAWGGHYLDRRFGTEPLFLLVGLLLGMAGSLVSLYWQVSAFWRSATPKASQRGASSGQGSESAGENRKEPGTGDQAGGSVDK